MVLLTKVGAVIEISPASDWMAPAWFVALLPAVSVTSPHAASVPFRFSIFAALMVSVLPADTVLAVCCHVRVSTCGSPSRHVWEGYPSARSDRRIKRIAFRRPTDQVTTHDPEVQYRLLADLKQPALGTGLNMTNNLRHGV